MVEGIRVEGIKADLPATCRCAVCDGPVTLANALLQKGKPLLVCRDFECQRIAGLQATLPPVLFKTQFDFQRQRILARKEQEAARKRHVDAIEQAEAQQNERLLQQFLAEHPALAETPPAILSLPSGRAGLEPLPESRLQKYRQHLQSIIQQAQESAGVEDLPSDQHTDAHATRLQVENLFDAHPVLQTVSDRFCAQCKGGCCAGGGEHAYLSAVTIRRQLDTEPGLTADVILQRYMQPLAPETVTDACVNQTVSGCVLPRELRSDVCNSYYCDSLRKLQREWAAGEAPAAVLVVQRSHTNWNRFDGESVSPVVDVALVNLST